MTKARKRWLIGLTAVIAILVAAGAGLFLVTERNRDASVEKLNAKVAAISGPQVPRQDANVAQEPARKASGQQPATGTNTSPSEDTVAAYRRVFRKKEKNFWEDPSYEVFCSKNPKEWTPAERDKISEFVEANLEVIRELRRLAELGGPVYKPDYSQGIGVDLPHLSPLRDCARLLAADTALKALSGDYGEAVEDIVSGMKLADTLDSDLVLISQLVRIAVHGMMYSEVARSIQSEDLTPGQARRLIECAAGAGGREGFANSFANEGILEVRTLDNTKADDLGLETLLFNTNWGSMDSVMYNLYGSPIGRLWLNRDEETYADITGRIGDAARLPFYEAKPLLDQVDKDVANLPRTRIFSLIGLPGLSRSVEVQAAHETRLDLMRLGLALEQYHVQNGKYPQSLEAVASTLGGVLPLDPFTGQPYVYEPADRSFRLYSARGNATDLSSRPPVLGADVRGNIVWRRGVEASQVPSEANKRHP